MGFDSINSFEMKISGGNGEVRVGGGWGGWLGRRRGGGLG